MDTVTATYWVLDANLPKVRSTVEKLARKATRLGTPPITLEELGFEDRPYNVADGKRTKLTPEQVKTCDRVVYYRFIQVKLTGAKPRLAGWTFVATLQHISDGEGGFLNVLRTSPDFEGQLPREYRTASPENCDHCRRSLSTRKETFIVLNDDGTWKQVGRNCTQDFLGGLDPHAVVAGLQDFLYLCGVCVGDEDGFGGGGYYEHRESIESFLTVTAAMVRVDGWVSRGQARNTEGLVATADSVGSYFAPPPRDAKGRAEWEAWKAEREPTDLDKATADKALTYAREDLRAREDLNDYLHNLMVACVQPTVDRKLFGITASLVPHYIREVERQVLKAREAEVARESTFAGTVGVRQVFSVTVLSVRTIESQNFGSLQLHKLVTEEGQLLTWFASGEALETGTTALIKATVKRHEDYKGVKQTVVNRVEVISAEQAALETLKAAKKAEKLAKDAALTPEQRTAKEAKLAAAKAKREATAAENREYRTWCVCGLLRKDCPELIAFKSGRGYNGHYVVSSGGDAREQLGYQEKLAAAKTAKAAISVPEVAQ